MSVQQWCAENGINDKTYYYQLRKVREQYVEFNPSIVPVTLSRKIPDIRIKKNGLQTSILISKCPNPSIVLVLT